MDNEEIKKRRAQLEQEDEELKRKEKDESSQRETKKEVKKVDEGEDTSDNIEEDSEEESEDDFEVGPEVDPEIDDEIEDNELEDEDEPEEASKEMEADSSEEESDPHDKTEIDESEEVEEDDKGPEDDKEGSEDPKDEEDPEGESEDPEGESEDPEDSKVDTESRRKLGPNREKEDSDDKSSKSKESTESSDSSDSDESLEEKVAGKALENMPGKAGEQSRAIMRTKAIAQTIVSAAKSAVNGITFLGNMLVSPVFWIAILILIAIVAIFSGITIMGGNDYNKACDYNGVGSVLVADDADAFTRQAAIASWLMSTPFKATGDQPMNKEQAAAVIGNFIQESYGANPKAIGGDETQSKWQTCDNDCILGWGKSGSPVGIGQWTGGRRVALANLAKSEGTQWYDLTTQLKYLKMELDGGGGSDGYELNQLNSGNFNGNHTLEEYTWIWQDRFERAGESRDSAPFKKRENYAQAFYAQFDGAGVSGGSLATQCVGGSGVVDASNLTQLALQISYSRQEKAARLGYGSCDSLTNCGNEFSKPEYIQAKKLAEEQTGADGFPGLTASCDRLVATLVRLTGMDTNFPWGGSAAQIEYMRSSPDWEPVSCQERQPGDVLGRPGHVMIYIGKVDGRDTISSASIALRGRAEFGRAAHLSDLTCKGDTWFADNGNAEGWRKVR